MTDMHLVISTIAPGEETPGPHVDYQKACRATAVLGLPEFRRFIRSEATTTGRYVVVGVLEDWFTPPVGRLPRKPAMLITPIPESEARELRKLSGTK